MKAIVIGSSLSGKTTIVRKLRAEGITSILEIDEELTRMNGGVYPDNIDYKHNFLVPQIVSKILGRNNIIFFTNTDYFSLQDLRIAKDKGFKILLISVDLNELQRRNKLRVENEGYEDLGKYLEGMVEYLNIVKKSGLAHAISGGGSVEEVLRDMKKTLNIE